jgi:DNA ligase-1
MFKPMLAPGEDPMSYPEYFQNLKFPLMVSPKYDGIRCIIKNHRAMSRTFKMLPSFQVQDSFVDIEHLDGELIEGDPTDFGVYNRTQSYVMSYDKIGNLGFFVFDYTHPDWLNRPFFERFDKLSELVEPDRIVPHTIVDNQQDLLKLEEAYLKEGFEGVMMRDPLGRYKCGRGTFKEGLIYKLKRFTDAEAKIVSVYEAMQNTNVAVKGALGYTERSSEKSGLVPSGMLGGFLVDFEGDLLNVAPGAFSHAERIDLLTTAPVGKLLKFRYMRHGSKDKPRFPRALGLRNETDL